MEATRNLGRGKRKTKWAVEALLKIHLNGFGP